jgi:Flp pilus assembly protein TadD
MFRKAYEADPTSSRALTGLSRSLLFDGQADKSVQIVADELKKHPDSTELERALASAQMAAGQFSPAIDTLKDVLSKTKEPRQQALLWSEIGNCYRYEGDHQRLIESFEEAYKRMPENAALARDLGMMYNEIGKTDIARGYYEKAIKLDHNDAFALNNLAYLLAESGGDLNVALDYARRAQQRLPTYAEITDTLGWIYMKKNLTDNALDSFKTIVTDDPKNPVYHYHYAMALNQKGDRETARKECQAALANKPNKEQETQIRQLMSRLS